jgi:hypothetical protein
MFKKRKYVPVLITGSLLLFFAITKPAYSQVSLYVHFPTFVYHEGHFTAVVGSGYYPRYYGYHPYYHPHYYHRHRYSYYPDYGYNRGYYRGYGHHDNGLHRGWYKNGHGRHGRR